MSESIEVIKMRLRSGEYDGTHIMHAICTIDNLQAEVERLNKFNKNIEHATMKALNLWKDDIANSLALLHIEEQIKRLKEGK